MKITKKYVYQLTAETLDKDINLFIKDAEAGAYQMDYKYGMNGLRIIKQYFKLIEQEFEQGNYELCKICYPKLFTILFGEGCQHSHFGYEDILGRSKLNFEKPIQNYFTCLIKLCSVEELFQEYVKYLNSKEDYYFEAAEVTIQEKLKAEDFLKFKKLLEKEAETVQDEDYGKMDILTFLLDLAKKDRNKEEYEVLAQKFAPVLGEEYRELLNEYEEDETKTIGG